MSLPTVAEHHHNICTRTFESIMSDPNHKLRKLLRPLYKSNYNLMHACTSTMPSCKTNRFKNSFFMASGKIVNNFQVSYYTLLVLAITIITHFYNYQYQYYYYHYLLHRHECFTGKYTTRKIHKNYIRDPSGLFSIISHVSLSMT